MKSEFDKKTIALAGMIQAICSVKELAQSGQLIEGSFESSIHSLFQFENKDVFAIYGGQKGIQFGLTKLIQIFGNQTLAPRRHLLKYLFAFLYLQKRIASTPKVLNQLTERMHQMEKQIAYFHLTHPTVIDNLSDIYIKTVGQFRHRIVIFGNSRCLRADLNLSKIRALLLAGIRSAFLWRELDGRILQLVFNRMDFKNSAEKLLDKVSV